MPNVIYSAETTIKKGYRVAIKARDHLVHLDEPKSEGGSDLGMTPVEALLGALGACKCMVAKSVAKSQGIDLQSITIKLEGDFNSEGYLGNPEVKIGFSEIRSIYEIESASSLESIKAFVEFIDSHCPVADTIANAPQLKSIIHYKSLN